MTTRKPQEPTMPPAGPRSYMQQPDGGESCVWCGKGPREHWGAARACNQKDCTDLEAPTAPTPSGHGRLSEGELARFSKLLPARHLYVSGSIVGDMLVDGTDRVSIVSDFRAQVVDPKHAEVVAALPALIEEVRLHRQECSRLERELVEMRNRAELAEGYIQDSTTSGGAVRVEVERLERENAELKSALMDASASLLLAGTRETPSWSVTSHDQRDHLPKVRR